LNGKDGPEHHSVDAIGRHKHEAHTSRPSLSAYAAVGALVSTVFAGHYESILFGIPLNRVALGLVLLLAVPRMLADGVRGNGLHVLLLCQSLWVTGSAISVSTLYEATSAFALVDEVLAPLLLTLVAPLAFAARADQLLLFKTTTLVGLYAGVVSVFQTLGLTQLLLPRYLSDAVASDQIDRAGGPFLQVGANGAALAMCLPFALVAFRRLKGFWRPLAALSVVACATGCLLTLTRSSWIAIVAGAVVYFCFDDRLRKAIPAMLGAVAVGVVVLLELVPGLYEATVDRFGTQRSLDDRSTTNAAAVSMLEENPLAGIGWGRFLSQVDEYVRQLDLVPLTTTHILAHNVVLSRAAELGAVGAGLFVASLVAGPGRASLRAADAGDLWRGVIPALFAAWLCVAMFTPMGYAFPNYLLWTATGIALSQQTTGSGLRASLKVTSTRAESQEA